MRLVVLLDFSLLRCSSGMLLNVGPVDLVCGSEKSEGSDYWREMNAFVTFNQGVPLTAILQITGD